MAPPDYANFGTFTDTEFRDVFHRHHHQVVPTGNVIHKLDTHYDTANSAPILSSVQASSMDATNTQGAWNLLLRSATNPLSQESITTANTAAWTANAIITATPSLTTLRSQNVHVTSSLTAGSASITGNLTAGNLSITGDIDFDSPTFKINSALNRVGILNVAPEHALDVSGNTNLSVGNGYRIAGTQVLSATALGSGVVTSSLTSVGTLGSLNVSGDTDIGLTLRREYTLTIPEPGSVLEFLNLLSEYGSYVVEIFLRQSSSNNQLAKHYKFSMRRNATNNQWKDLLPSSTDGPEGNDINMWINSFVQGDGICGTRLRIARTFADANVSNTDVVASVIIHKAPEQFQFSPLNTVVQNPNFVIDESYQYDFFESTKLCSTRDGVCIDAFDSQGYKLFVNGNVGVAGTFSTNNITVAGALDVENILVSSFEAQNMRVTGDLDVGYMKRREFIVTAISNKGVDFCEVSSQNGSFLMEMTIVQSKADNQTAKYYKFPVTANATMGEWKFLLPFVDEGLGPNDFVMQIKVTTDVTGTFAALRLISVSGTNKDNSDIAVSLTAHGTIGNDIVITHFPDAIEEVFDPNVEVYSGTMMTVSKNMVGIGNFGSENPANNPPNDPRLAVLGNVFISDTLSIGGVTAGNLMTSGNTKSGNATVFTLADSTTFNFSDKMRFYYNADIDALEIQRNIAGTWTKSATLAV